MSLAHAFTEAVEKASRCRRSIGESKFVVAPAQGGYIDIDAGSKHFAGQPWYHVLGSTSLPECRARCFCGIRHQCP